MKSQAFPSHRDHLLVLNPDDEFFASLTDFAKRNRIEGGSFSAIGAFQSATVAYWNRETKQYENIEVAEQVEVVALNGSIARSGDGVKIHSHAVLGLRNGSTVGGHLVRGVVYPTVEIFVVDYGTRLTRRIDDKTGLFLLDI
ncbi:MAG TPA: PPC domain-containing DNA-binding protein [Thermoanaerobaculia bacterium]|nr:PPC domain-containing DNA-binding protein [Thermoanaerobaculia bacterium]